MCKLLAFVVKFTDGHWQRVYPKDIQNEKLIYHKLFCSCALLTAYSLVSKNNMLTRLGFETSTEYKLQGFERESINLIARGGNYDAVHVVNQTSEPAAL